MGVEILKITLIFKEKEKRNCKDFRFGQDLMEFTKIITPKSSFFKKQNWYFGNFGLI
jgi:hypothetical protein